MPSLFLVIIALFVGGAPQKASVIAAASSVEECQRIASHVVAQGAADVVDLQKQGVTVEIVCANVRDESTIVVPPLTSTDPADQSNQPKKHT